MPSLGSTIIVVVSKRARTHESWRAANVDSRALLLDASEAKVGWSEGERRLHTMRAFKTIARAEASDPRASTSRHRLVAASQLLFGRTTRERRVSTCAARSLARRRRRPKFASARSRVQPRSRARKYRQRLNARTKSARARADFRCTFCSLRMLKKTWNVGRRLRAQRTTTATISAEKAQRAARAHSTRSLAFAN